MSVISPVVTYLSPTSISVKWPAMSPGDSGDPVEVAGFARQIVQASPGTSDDLRVEFSNDGSTFGSVGPDITGYPADVTARARFTKPNYVSGSGGPLDVILYCYSEA